MSIVRVCIHLLLLSIVLLFAVPANAQGHTATLTWVLSVDDTTTDCTISAVCTQAVYRAPGACSSTSVFAALSSTVSATATTFTDSTVTPGNWCYAVTFTINGLESAKDTFTVSLQPAPPTGGTGKAT